LDTLILNADSTPLSHIPLSVVPWQVAIKLFYLGKIRIVKEYDNRVVRSQTLSLKVPSIAMMVDQVNLNRGVKYSRHNVYLRDNFTCQLQITKACMALKGKVKFTELTLDHVVPKSQGGKTNWSNVSTSCHECNSRKGDNRDIIPKTLPYKPSYYEILARRKSLPLQVKDIEWAYYINWPEDLVKVVTDQDTII